MKIKNLIFAIKATTLILIVFIVLQSSSSVLAYKRYFPCDGSPQAASGCTTNYGCASGGSYCGVPSMVTFPGLVCSDVTPACGLFYPWLDIEAWTNGNCPNTPGTGWTSAQNTRVTVDCCENSDCSECQVCDGGFNCVPGANGISCSSESQGVCLNGFCEDPDENQNACTLVSWDCTSKQCQYLDKDKGYWESPYSQSTYTSSLINNDTFDSGTIKKCCGDDNGEQTLYTTFCSGYCPFDYSHYPSAGICAYRKDTEPHDICYKDYKETNNCCDELQCASGYNCYDSEPEPSGECYSWHCYDIDGIAKWTDKDCGNNASCSGNNCNCDSGYADCNGDNSCNCDLATSVCSGGSCIDSPCECSSGDFCCTDGCNFDSSGTACSTENCGQCDLSGNCNIGIPDQIDYTMPGDCVYDGYTVSRSSTNIHFAANTSMTLINGSQITINSLDISSGNGDTVFINTGTRLIFK